MKTEKQNKIIEPYAIRDINWEKPIQSPSEHSVPKSTGVSEGVHSQGERANYLASQSMSNKRDRGNPDTSNNIHSPMHNPKTSDDSVRVGVKAQKQEDTSNNSTKQVEELEKGFELNNLDCDKEILADLINRAKLLKTEIEKGCGLKIMTVNGNEIKCGEFALGKRRYCNFHKNLIQRLNKIIGEKE